MDKDNRDVSGLSVVDPHLNCGFASKLLSSIRTMLKDAATLSWPGLVKQVLPGRDSCCRLVPMVRSRFRALVQAEQCYRLLSCPGSAAAAVAVAAAAEQLGVALAAEQLEQPTAEGAAA